MIKHVVMWTFAAEKKQETIERACQLLEAMPAQIPAIETLEVGRNFSDRPVAHDLVLITTHKDRQALQEYQQHPQHVKVAEFIGSAKEQAAVVDFEYS